MLMACEVPKGKSAYAFAWGFLAQTEQLCIGSCCDNTRVYQALRNKASR